LAGRLFSLKADVENFLQTTRAARLGNLTERHDTAVAAAREANDALATARRAEEEGMKRWFTLDGDAKNALKVVQGAESELAKANRALLTRKEISVFEARIASWRQKLTDATDIEQKAFSEYRQLVAAREELEKAHHAAVSAATSLSNQIDKL
jgi:chromosome segregation ATPase